MCKTRYVFAFCACGRGGVLSRNLLAGNISFYVFMFPENKPVGTLLSMMKNYPLKVENLLIIPKSYISR
jgi:hypothetical protein